MVQYLHKKIKQTFIPSILATCHFVNFALFYESFLFSHKQPQLEFECLQVRISRTSKVRISFTLLLLSVGE